MRNRRKVITFLSPFIIIWIVFIFAFVKKRSSPDSVLGGLTSFDELGCGCPRLGQPITLANKVSLCSDWSTSRGEGQKVIAYTIYGNHGNKRVLNNYYKQIEDRIKEANVHYKVYVAGWIVRLYHNTSRGNKFSNDMICRLFCQYPAFDPCQVNSIPIPESWVEDQFSSFPVGSANPEMPKSLYLIDAVQMKFMDFLTSLTNPHEQDDGLVDEESAESFEDHVNPATEEETTKTFGKVLIGKLWRFLPLGDDTVDEFLVRDVDSFILPREVHAVHQWLENSTALVHAMRDHPSHNGVILAGMWGGTRWRDKEIMTGFLKKILRYPPRNLWNYDQIILKRIIWPDVSDRILVHDSYHCRNPFLQAKHRAVAYPTKRRGRLFVSWGPNRSPSELRNIIPCPVECRPRDHPEWEYC